MKESHKNWTKGPYKLRDDEIKFVQECIVKPGQYCIFLVAPFSVKALIDPMHHDFLFHLFRYRMVQDFCQGMEASG